MGTPTADGVELAAVARRKRFSWPAAFLALNAVGLAIIAWQAGEFARPSGRLAIASRSPSDDESPRDVSRISVRFSYPVDAATVKDDALALVPGAQGKVLFDGDRELRLELTRPLTNATTYRLLISRKLRGLNGERPTDELLYFSTAPLAVESVSQSRIERGGTYLLDLRFSGPVNPLELAKHLKLTSPDGRAIPFEMIGGKPDPTVRVRVKQNKWDQIKLRISEKLTGTEGPLPLGKSYETPVDVAGKLRFQGITAECRSERAVVRVKMNSPVEAASAGQFVEIDPPVKHAFESDYQGLRIVGEFQPRQRYSITLKAGLAGGAAGTLDKTVTRAVWIPDRDPSLRFAFGGGYLAPDGLLKVPIRSVNVKKAKLSAQRLYASNIVEYAVSSDGDTLETWARDLPQTEMAIENRLNQETETLLDLRSLAGAQVRGVYGLAIRDAEEYWRDDHAIVVVTDLGLSARLSQRRALVWVTSISAARPVPGVEVTVYSDRRQKMGTATADASGLADIALGALPEGENPAVVVATHGPELTYITLDKDSRPRGAGSASGRPYLSSGYEVFVCAERGVYRPGDTVRLSGLVRGASFEPPGAMPLELVVEKPSGRELLKKVVMSDSAGRLLADVPIPTGAPSGLYKTAWRLPGKQRDELGSTTFRVADYIPMTLRMTLDAPGGGKAGLPASKPLVVKAHVEHLFGDPARGLSVACRATYAAAEFRPDGWVGFTFGDRRVKPEKSAKDLADQQLDDTGNASFSLTAPKVSTYAAIRANVEIEVREPGGRALVESISRRLDPWTFYLGVRAAGASTAPPDAKNPADIQPGRPAAFSIAAAAPDGSAFTDAKRFTASLYRTTWSNVLRHRGRGRLEYEWTRQDKFAAKTEGDFAEGRASAALTPELPGSYRLVIESKDGCAATLDFCVGGPGEQWAVADPEEIHLSFDRTSYRPGETARLHIRAPFGGTALLCVETDRVLHSRVVALPRGEGAEEFTVDERWRPNAYVTATLVRPVAAEDDWLPHRASGVARLDVDCSDRKLDVAIESAPEVRPEREIELAVRVTSRVSEVLPNPFNTWTPTHAWETPLPWPEWTASAPPPVECVRPSAGAAVTVAAVDEGVLALTGHRSPDPWNFFYSARRLGVEEYDMFSRLAPELAAWKAAKPPAPGGDGGDESEAELPRLLNPIQAQRVKTAVLYTGTLTADENGVARVKFTVPEYVGELRVMAWVAKDSRFGSAQRPLTVKSPLMCRASWPRFLAPGDEFDLPVTIFNRTAADGDVEIRLSLEGPMSPAPGSSAACTVPVPRGGEKTVRLRLRATDVGKVSARVSVSLGQESYRESVELPVRPAAAFARAAGSAVIEGPEEKAITVTGDFLPGTDKCTVVLGASPAVDLTGALNALLEYPYGCVEQTTSRLVPLVYLRDLAELTRPQSVGAEEIDELMQAGFVRLQMMQTYGGGLTMWPGGSNPWPWGSIYAADILVEARKAGYKVPSELLDPLLAYISDELENWSSADKGKDSEEGTLSEAAYACYVLARAGQPAYQWMGRLEEVIRDGGQKTVPPSARFHLAAACLAAGVPQSGDASSANRLAKEFVAPALTPSPPGAAGPQAARSRQTGGSLSSPVREAAIMLLVLLDLDPSSEQVPLLVHRLKSGLHLGAWGTTQENAFALMALGKYARRMGAADTSATVTLPDGSVRKFNAREGLRLDRVAPGQSVRVKVEGKGKVFAFWYAEGVPRKGEVAEQDSGISIRRTILEADGKTAVDPAKLVQGKLYQVRLILNTDRPAHNLVVTELLPAGLEIENPELRGTARAKPKASNAGRASRVPEQAIPEPEDPADDESTAVPAVPASPPPAGQAAVAAPQQPELAPFVPECIDRRDDRVLLFGTAGQGQTEFRYLVRAVTAGTFVLPASEASCMYDPTLYSVNGRGIVKVTP